MISIIKNGYGRLIGWGTAFQPILLLAIRLFWGYSFLKAGMEKLQNIELVIRGFENMGFPLAFYNAYAVGYIEAVGGLCLIVGFACRLVTIPLSIIMIVALFTAHLHVFLAAWEDPQQFVSQAAFQHLLACSIVFAFGPGALSIDALLERMTGKSSR